MSNFSKKGKRRDMLKKVYAHKKQAKDLMKECELLGLELNSLYPDLNIEKRDEVRAKAKTIVGRDLDTMELILVIAKINDLRDE